MVAIKSKGGDGWHYDVICCYVVLDGNLLDEFPFDSNLFVKDVKLMYLQVSSNVTEKGIPISGRGRNDEGKVSRNICRFDEGNPHIPAGSMKPSHVYIQNLCIRSFCEENSRIHTGIKKQSHL